MRDVWTFLQAVGSHWIALAGGAAVVVLLGVYEKLTKNEIARRYYVILLVAFVAVAIYQAWLDEHTRVKEFSAQIDKDRPYFRREASQIVPLRAVQAGQPIEGHQVAVKLRNSGASPAQHVSVHIISAEVALDRPPIVNYRLDAAMEIGPGGPLLISKHINIPPNARPALFMFDVRYQSPHDRDYRQMFFAKFSGSAANGAFETDLYEPPLSEAAALAAYAASYVSQAKTYEASQTGVSIP
jgi:hypothetical protein